MPGITTLATLALFGLASAAPVVELKSRSEGGGVFTVTNTPTGNTKARNGKNALMKAYSKHGIQVAADFFSATTDELTAGLSSFGSEVPSSDKAASGSQTAESGQVAANSVTNDLEYTSQVSVGGQLLTMDFDTGSSDFWVMNTQMPSSLTQGHTLFDPTKSTTFKQMQGSSFAVRYGDSSNATGNVVGTDVVNIGGAVVQDQVIELPNQVTSGFVKDTSSNGLIGLAFSKLNTVKPQQAKTFLENVQGQLASPVMTANLKHAATGSYTFGTIDSTQYSGPLVFTAVNTSSGFWQFESPTFAVGNGAIQTNPQASPAIADTGTSLLLMDPAVVQAYYSQVAGQVLNATEGGYVFPCSSTLPDLKIGISANFMNTIPGSLLNYAPANPGYCFGGLQSNQGSGMQILGDILFKAQFVALNIGNSTIGFANHAN